MKFKKDFDEKYLYKGTNVTLEKLIKILQQMLKVINKSNQNFAIYEHNVWPRYDSFDRIKEGTFKNGLYVNTISVASTTNIIGNTKSITPENIIDYHYDCEKNAPRINLGVIVPLTIEDEYKRTINFALDKHHPQVPWTEGKRSSILDFLVGNNTSLSNVYSLFNLDINPGENLYSYEINTRAIPFFSKDEIKEHDLHISRIIKNILVNQYKILTEEEYKTVENLNPYIDKLILEEYNKNKDEIYANPVCWEEP